MSHVSRPSGNRKAPVGEPGGDSVLIYVNSEPTIYHAQHPRKRPSLVELRTESSFPDTGEREVCVAAEM